MPFFLQRQFRLYMSSVGVCVSVTRGASTILRERLLRIPDTCSLKDLLSKIATDASGWVWLRKDGRDLVIVRRPTDLQLRETVGIPETRYFFYLYFLGVHSVLAYWRLTKMYNLSYKLMLVRALFSFEIFTLTTPSWLLMSVQYLEKLYVSGWGIMAAGCVQNQVSL